MLLKLEIVAGVVFFLWLTGLTGWLFLIRKRQKRLVWGEGDKELEKILKLVGEKMESLGNSQESLRGRLEEQVQKAKRLMRQPGVVKYNPFPETGGDHSFSATFLDGGGDGLVLTGLHAREGTRVYIKPVRQGRSEYKLSTEEEKSLREALKKLE